MHVEAVIGQSSGWLDLVVVSPTTNSISVLYNSGSAGSALSTYLTGQGATRSVIADVDADGNLDIVTTSTGSTAGTLLLGIGDGTFSVGQAPNFGMPTDGLAAADFNGDGRLDLAASGDGEVVVLFGVGDGTFPGSLRLAGLPQSQALIAVDMNRDGRVDLLEGSATTAVIGVFFNDCL
jgi:hypothetical protein